MRVQNITAEPQGMKLGDYLAWYVADTASKLGIGYILAMHVVPKARNFYLRLGFQEYNRSRAYGLLLEEKARIEEAMKKEGSDLVTLGEQQQALIEDMSEATLFVDTATLKAKARENWESYWRKLSPGDYVKIKK